MTDIDERAFRAGFTAGFAATREGFNGECAFNHLAPHPFETPADIEQTALDAYRGGPDAFDAFLASLERG